MEILTKIISLYLLVLATETIVINLFYPHFPLLPGDFPLNQYGFSARIPFLSSLFVAIIISLLIANVPLSLFRIF